MALQNTPQSIPSDGRQFDPAQVRRAVDVVGPPIVIAPIIPGAQSNRATQVKRNAAESTNARQIDRSSFYGAGTQPTSPA